MRMNAGTRSHLIPMLALRRLMTCAVLLLGSLSANFASAQEIPGIWWTPKKDGKLEFFLEPSGNLSARIIAILPKSVGELDSRNPDPQLRSRRVLGAVIFSGFKPETKIKWVDGKVYDPQTGGTYDAKLWLENPNTLMLRGFLGISLFGLTETFNRVAGGAPRTRQADEPDLVHFTEERGSKGKVE